MTVHARVRVIMAAGFILLTMSSAAQVHFGELRMSMNGTVAPGYSATSGNTPGLASHSWTFGGASTLTGSYHSPNFFSFNAGLYLNQSRANSDFQSISNASGVDLTSTIFGGSKFPGSVGYNLAYNSDGNYGIPGLANYVTHGTSDAFSVGWSENVSNVPSLSAAFQLGRSKYTVYGANEDGGNSFRSLNLHSSHRLAGFGLGAFYSNGASREQIPGVILGESTVTMNSGDDSYGFNVSHRLPFSGSIAGGFNRTSFDTNFEGSTASGTIDLMSVQAVMHPLEKVSVSAGANYSDNLSGQIAQTILNSGGAVPGLNLSESSSSLDLDGVVGYSPAPNLQTSFTTERRTQSYFGKTYGVTSYGVSAAYAHVFRVGSFNTAVNALDNSDDQSGDNSLGFSLDENYSGEFRNWKLNANLSYAQNVQTLLVTYMNSFYNYSVNAHRRWGNLTVGAGAGAGRTALSGQEGTESDEQGYNASVGYGRWITTAGSYNRAHGQALATGAGLVPVPVPPPVLPSSLLSFYGGNGYAFSVSSSPVEKMIFSATYAKSLSNTSGQGVTSQNENDQYNALLQYRVRKLNFTSGYARMQQGFSGSGVPPQIVTSYYAGISRWFKFF